MKYIVFVKITHEPYRHSYFNEHFVENILTPAGLFLMVNLLDAGLLSYQIFYLKKTWLAKAISIMI